MKKTLIVLMALAGIASADTIALTLPANGTNNGANGSTSATSALTRFANSADGAYMFNNGGAVNPGGTHEEGILRTNDNGQVYLTMAPRTGAGGSGEAIVMSGTELNGYTVESLTFTIAESACTTTADITLTLAVLENTNDAWAVKESAKGAITLGSGASLTLTLGSAIEWADTYKVVAMVDNTDKLLGGGDSPLYYLTGISVTANTAMPESPAAPEPTTATLSLLALAGLAARRRRR
ncbi:MAG: PEP-CTERM sorting domain-containing protein [Akkermansia sp.]|nr:PEP-CTERM sorting domain-containing protein [Akkermansia sp.]